MTAFRLLLKGMSGRLQAAGLLAVVVLSIAGCGSARVQSSSRARDPRPPSSPTASVKPATPAEEELSIDRDGDGDTAVGFDDNHEGAPDLVGRPASAAERRAVAAIVDRYYRYALAGSARVACDLLYPTLEHSAAEDYGREPSVPYLHGGKSCQEILTRLFTHFHHRLSVLVPLLSVAAVRDVNDHAMVFLHFRGFPARELSLRRYRGSWRLSDLIDYAVT